MGQRMADSQSNSRKGFPETGGKCCQRQGQEEMMYLKGHGVSNSPFPLGWPLTLASSKSAFKLEPALPG